MGWQLQGLAAAPGMAVRQIQGNPKENQLSGGRPYRWEGGTDNAQRQNIYIYIYTASLYIITRICPHTPPCDRPQV